MCVLYVYVCICICIYIYIYIQEYSSYINSTNNTNDDDNSTTNSTTEQTMNINGSTTNNNVSHAMVDEHVAPVRSRSFAATVVYLLLPLEDKLASS